MSVAADAVARMLTVAGVDKVFTVAPSALECREPVVVLDTGYKRDAVLAEGERGVSTVEVLVCRSVASEGESAAGACEAAIVHGVWESHTGDAVRVCGIDCGAPEGRGRDGSGRWLFGLEVRVTVVRCV